MKTKHSKIIIWILFFYQLISVYLLSTGVVPFWFALVNLSLGMAFILLAPMFSSLLYLIVSVPFFITFPNAYSDTMSEWRVLFLWLFTVWFVKVWFVNAKNVSAKNVLKKLYFGLINLFNDLKKNFFTWDIYILVFGLISFFSIALANYKFHAAKQAIFFLNLYIFYIVFVNTVKTRKQILAVIKYSATSLATIVFLGYIQFVITFLVPQYFFWQYWATMISKVYYGLSLANVLIYSNSWFSYTGPTIDLRMFSVMPDSHSFAMICALLIAFLLPLTYLDPKNAKKLGENIKYYPKRVVYLIWSGIRFAGLAIIFSGTRGVWVGLLAPFFFSIIFYFKKISRPLVKKVFWSFAMIIIFFLLSPAINYGLHKIKVQNFRENFLSRAESIYDLEEESNANRILIWKHSLEYFVSHPLGVGAGNFIVSLVPDSAKNLPFNELGSLKNYRYNLPQKFVTAHSLYLNLLVELGLLGFVAFILIFINFFWKVWQFIRENKADNNLFIFFVLNTAFLFLWFLAYGVFDVTLFNDRVMIYTLICLGLSGVIIKNYREVS